MSKIERWLRFGIKPTRPETGYGYLELSTDSLDDNGTSDLKKFVEKPNLQDAKKILWRRVAIFGTRGYFCSMRRT